MHTAPSWRCPRRALLTLALLVAACGGGGEGEAVRTITTDAEGNVTSDSRDGDDAPGTDADAGANDDTDAADAEPGSDRDDAAADEGDDMGGQVAVDGNLLIAESVTCTPMGPPGAGDIELTTDDGTLVVTLAGATEDSYLVSWTPGVFGVDTMRSFSLDFNDDRPALAAGVQAFDIEVGTSGSLVIPPSSDEAVAEQPDGVTVQWNGRCSQ